MSAALPFATDVDVALVPDATYGDVAFSIISTARSICYANIFIVDPDPGADPELKVLSLLHGLSEAQWRGVDTRLLIGGSSTNPRIRETCLVSLRLAESLGLSVRLSNPGDADDGTSSHSKVLISESSVLAGSHNWSGGALSTQVQDSLFAEHPALTGYFATRFLDLWARAERPENV